jgi:hypothetical protein
VDRAAKGVRVVEYDVAYEPLGASAAAIPRVQGHVWMSGWSEEAPARFRADARVVPAGVAKPFELSLGRDAGQFYLVDHGARTASVGPTPIVAGRYLPVLRSVLVQEFVHPRPFEEELSADEQKLRGTRTIAGEDCLAIRVVYPNERKAEWVFSKQDLLPREIHRWIPTLDGEMEGRQTIANVRVNASYERDPFELAVPAGYTRASLAPAGEP